MHWNEFESLFYRLIDKKNGKMVANWIIIINRFVARNFRYLKIQNSSSALVIIDPVNWSRRYLNRRNQKKKRSCRVLHISIRRREESLALIECAYLFRIVNWKMCTWWGLLRFFSISFSPFYLFVRFAVKQNRIEEYCWPIVQFACQLPMFTYSVNLSESISYFLRRKERGKTIKNPEWIFNG